MTSGNLLVAGNILGTSSTYWYSILYRVGHVMQTNVESRLISAKMRLILQIVLVALTGIAVHGLWSSVESGEEPSSVNNNVAKRKKYQMSVDVAVVTVESSLNISVVLLSISDACYQCQPQVKKAIPKFQNTTVWFDTSFTQHLVIKDYKDYKDTPCNITKTFVDQGEYVLNLTREDGKDVSCVLSTTYSPSDCNIPVYVALSVIILLFLVWHLLQFLIRKRVFTRFAIFFPDQSLINSDLGMPLVNEDGAETMTQKKRVKSVDAFRGLSLVVMIFVNYGGGEYWYFQHSAWDGLTVADLVFPWFVFLMGTSIAMSFKGALRRGTSRLVLFWRVVRRTIILFFLGLVISNSSCGRDVSLETLRILGVLQRLALTYFVVAALETISASATDVHLRKWWSFARDLVPFWPTWLVTACLVILHTCLTFLLPVPGCPTGYLGPGGLSEGGVHENCTGGAAQYIDRLILGESHMYQFPTCKRVYQTSVPFDPEGILGTLMSVLLCVLGLQAGKILITYQSWLRRVKRWMVWAVFTGLLAGILCRFDQYEGWVPVNKNLWSLSYVLALGSMAFLLLSLLYIVIDVFELWTGAPFLYPGMNSIVIYVCHEVFEAYFPLEFRVEDTHLKHLLMNIWGACFWLIVSAILFYKDIFIAI